MSKLRRILPALLALIMLFSCFSVAALADDVTSASIQTGNYTLTVSNTENQTGHTYELYQIFTGDWDDSSSTLSTVKWGVSIVKTGDGTTYDLSTALIEALKADINDNLHNTFKTALQSKDKDAVTAQDIADVLAMKNNGQASVLSENDLDEFAQIVYNLISAKVAEGTNIEKVTQSSSTETEDTVDSSKKYQNYTFSNLAAGYYMITESGTTGSLTRFILQVVQDITVNPKTQPYPTIDKNIAKVGETETASTDKKATSASVGDVITFELTGSVPVMTYYNAYYYIVNDTMSKGLDFQEIESVTIKATDKTDVTVTAYDSATQSDSIANDSAGKYCVYTVTPEAGDTGRSILKIVFHNFEQYNDYAGGTVTINYTAKLTTDAAMGTSGNPNEVTLTYSNNPDFNYDGTKDEPGEDVPSGETPKSEVTVYTTAIRIRKVNESGKSLEGAHFTLTGNGVNVVLVITENYKPVDYVTLGEQTATTNYNNTDNKTIYYELKGVEKDGVLQPNTFTTVAPKTDTLDQYATEYIHYSDAQGTVKADGEYIAVANGGSTTYVKEAEYSPKDGDTVASAVAMLIREDKTEILGKGQGANSTDTEVLGVTNEDGFLVFRGLGAGTYTLTETQAPAGYNKLSGAITVTVKFALNGTTPDWLYDMGGTGVTHTRLADQSIQIKVVNVSGAGLPSTGGIGTTIFYVLGSILVLCAAVLLIVKKRMSSENS